METQNENNEVKEEKNIEEGKTVEQETPQEEKVVDPIDDLTCQLLEQKDRYLRLLAEYDNYRKRSSREINDARVNARIGVISELLPVFDYLGMAADHAETPNVNIDSIRQGLQMIFSQYHMALNNIGVTKLDAVGAVFDPNIHEAVAQETSDDIEAGKIIRQWKCGYKIGDRLIRPATVVVSSGVAPAEVAEEKEVAEEVAEGVVTENENNTPSGEPAESCAGKEE